MLKLKKVTDFVVRLYSPGRLDSGTYQLASITVRRQSLFASGRRHGLVFGENGLAGAMAG